MITTLVHDHGGSCAGMPDCMQDHRMNSPEDRPEWSTRIPPTTEDDRHNRTSSSPSQRTTDRPHDRRRTQGMDAVTRVPAPANEPVGDYAPGSPERAAVEKALVRLASERIDLPSTIGGRAVVGSGCRRNVVQPHARRSVLGTFADATADDAQAALAAARAAAPGWRALSFDDRAAIFLKAADLLAGPWRQTLNAATMLGQSKTVYQAEIDAACELIDFWRFNVHFARELLAEQPPANARGVWNRTDHRPLEGFVYAITPFNFTAIGGNLPTAPALMGNVVIWKPASTQMFAAHFTMRVLEAAGLPPGVINLVTGGARTVSEVLLAQPDLAGIHFTGSTATFHTLWRSVAANLDTYRGYPRLVGETGGKDFVLAHPSADVDVLRTAMVRGAFEYQGQKCSAASRAYVPRSIWRRLRTDLVETVESLTMGPVTDLSNFMGAVIDDKAYADHVAAIERARSTSSTSIIAGGTYDDREGWFVRPTLVLGEDPADEVFTTEYFGPILSIHVYPDRQFGAVMRQLDEVSSYALTGAIIAQDRTAIAEATSALRYAAGNFYVNDKPTGAVVGQQPFGGARASGTNDKAGATQNLLRWTSTRSIKETFVPPTSHRYPHMA
jgi:1-pyrroline-5-carboxylate dehydrogenase